MSNNNQLPPNVTSTKRVNRLLDVDGDDSSSINGDDDNNNYDNNMTDTTNGSIHNNYNTECINRATTATAATTTTATPTFAVNGLNATIATADVVVAAAAAAAATTTTTIAAAAPFTLPDGRMIDGKNTLQSFAVPSRQVVAVAAPAIPKNDNHHRGNIGIVAARTTAITASVVETATTAPAPFTLFDGRLIDGKNTLQSFAISDSRIVAAAVAANASSKPSINTPVVADALTTTTPPLTTIQHHRRGVSTTDETNSIIRMRNNCSSNRHNPNEEAIIIQAVPAQSFVVAEGHLFDSGIQSSPPPPPPREVTRSTTFWLANIFAMLLVAGATGIGVYCGTGNCVSSSVSVSSTSGEPNTPSTDLRPVPTTTATIAPVVASSGGPPVAIVSPMNSTTSPVLAPLLPPSLTNRPTRTPSTRPVMVVGTNVPILAPSIVTPSPSTMTMNKQQLMVACNFFSITNVSECEATTSFDSFNTVTTGNTIPTEIGLLTQLTLLNLFSDGLTGTIPSTLGSLTQLTYLSLYDNQLNGTIPSTLGNLIRLHDLSLYINQLTGTIPSSLGNLLKLNGFYLWGNQLNGTIPSTLGYLVNITDLDLSSNQLTGTIPSTFGKLVKMTALVLFNNIKLGGTIPSSLCSVSSGIDIYIECENIECSCCQSYNDGTGVTANCSS